MSRRGHEQLPECRLRPRDPGRRGRPWSGRFGALRRAGTWLGILSLSACVGGSGGAGGGLAGPLAADAGADGAGRVSSSSGASSSGGSASGASSSSGRSSSGRSSSGRSSSGGSSSGRSSSGASSSSGGVSSGGSGGCRYTVADLVGCFQPGDSGLLEYYCFDGKGGWYHEIWNPVSGCGGAMESGSYGVKGCTLTVCGADGCDDYVVQASGDDLIVGGVLYTATKPCS